MAAAGSRRAFIHVASAQTRPSTGNESDAGTIDALSFSFVCISTNSSWRANILRWGGRLLHINGKLCVPASVRSPL